MSWQEYGIEEVCELIVDCVNRTAPVVDYETPYKMIRTSNVRNGWIDMTDARNVTKDTYEKWTRRAVPRQGDVVLTREAPLGEIGLIRTDEPVFLGQRTVMYRTNPEKMLPHFLYYSLLGHDVQAQIQAFGFGSTVSHMRVPDAKKLLLKVPDTTTQEKIIFVLDAYDTMIEANKRRIQLLEESARLLYREWFVKMRFPGHETIPVTDGVPEGWEKRTLGNYATLNYGKGLKDTDRIDGDYPVYGSSGIVGYHDKPLITGPAIIVGRKGNVGSVYYSHFPSFPIDTVYFISSEQTSYYLYLTLQGFNFISSDAAVPGLNRSYAYSQYLLVPSPNVFTAFEEKVQPIFEQTNAIIIWNKKLCQAHDMLLPKLMSGALDVSRIAVPKEVAA